MRRMIGLVAATVALAAPVMAAEPQDYGVWRNPKNSVHVRIRTCGEGACGVVVWANDKAKADSRRGGTAELIGLTLFRNFMEEKDGFWRGRVFVPDLNGTFSGTAQVLDPTTIRVRGCAFGGLKCKTQDWKRIDGG